MDGEKKHKTNQQSVGHSETIRGGWGRKRREVWLWILLVMLTGSLLYRWINDRYEVNTPFVVHTEKSDRVIGSINPNRASWASLARLPGIGPDKAQRIVQYREEYQKENGPDSMPFKTGDDLCNVKGIGKVTVEKIKEYLVYGTMGDTKE